MSWGPVESTEFRRIAALPRFDWQTDPDLDELTLGLTWYLKTPRGQMTLKKIQAAALNAAYQTRGLFAAMPVGSGKTLVTLLAPGLLGAKRPLLLLPASVRDQTVGWVIPEMREHWKLHPNLTVMSYEELSLERNADFLERLRPDCIIPDEAHMLKHLSSGRTKRITRYMAANPLTPFLPLSGTSSSYTIMSYWHLVHWALKPQNAPVPTGWHEADQWARALDERVPHMERLAPGALLNLSPPRPEDAAEEPIVRARHAYRDRLTQTMGVVAGTEKELGTSLLLKAAKAPRVPPEVKALQEILQDTWATPTGEEFTEATRLAAHMRTAACGFYNRWDPQPPEEWMKARSAWMAIERHILKYNRRQLDTAKQVRTWVKSDSKAAQARAVLEHWEAVEPTFKPNSVPVWVSDYLVRACAEWLEDGPGIVWTYYPAFGQAVARMARAPYFGEGDSSILDASGPIVASADAHGTGKNLQQWNRNLLATPTKSGEKLEQLIGRTHRMGQMADVVTFEVFQHMQIYRDDLQNAFAEARMAEQTMRSPQRLLYCDTEIKRD